MESVLKQYVQGIDDLAFLIIVEAPALVRHEHVINLEEPRLLRQQVGLIRGTNLSGIFQLPTLVPM